MSISVLARQLMSQEIFRGLSPLQLTEIVRQAERVVYRPGQSIVQAGEQADAAVVVIAGDAVRFTEVAPGEGAPQAYAVHVGSILGELAMLVDHEHGSTVVAHTTVRVLRITREALQAQMREDPRLADHFVDRISARLRQIAEELRALDQELHDLDDGDLATPRPSAAIPGRPVAAEAPPEFA
jgi:CRP-like cAMP-binding protein